MSDLQILQDLHDSEINARSPGFYDGAWRRFAPDFAHVPTPFNEFG
jgi:hypothetical protein